MLRNQRFDLMACCLKWKITHCLRISLTENLLIVYKSYLNNKMYTPITWQPSLGNVVSVGFDALEKIQDALSIQIVGDFSRCLI